MFPRSVLTAAFWKGIIVLLCLQMEKLRLRDLRRLVLVEPRSTHSRTLG